MTDVYAYLQARHERILQELIEFVSIPSVSTDPAHRDDIQKAVHWVADQLAGAGAENVQIISTEKHPVVYGEWLHAPDAPTLLVYGHYDVQPPDPLDKWHSEPFKAEVREGRLYGRGVSDDKGPVLIPLKVAEAYLTTAGKLPINVKFLIEGEEEIGSPSLAQVIAKQRDLLTADFVLSADGAMWRADLPSLTVSSRGMTGLEFTLQGAAKDLHSGRHGGAVANPLHAIAELVARLHTADGRVAVAGFYDDVQDYTPEERAAIQNLPFADANYLTEIGAPELWGEVGFATLERLWIRPTLEINGMWGGYQGPGSKTVIPGEAHAKITCRLVAGQNPQDIQQKVIAHLHAHCPRGVTLTIDADPHMSAAYQIPPNHPGLHVASAVLQSIHGRQPLMVRMGGTLPIAEAFKRVLGLETVFFSFSTADEDFHAPNEFFRIQKLHNGLMAWAKYWELLSELSPAAFD